MRRTAYYYARHSGRCRRCARARETISRQCQFAHRQRERHLLKSVIDRADKKDEKDYFFPREVSSSSRGLTVFPFLSPDIALSPASRARARAQTTGA